MISYAVHADDGRGLSFGLNTTQHVTCYLMFGSTSYVFYMAAAGVQLAQLLVT